VCEKKGKESNDVWLHEGEASCRLDATVEGIFGAWEKLAQKKKGGNIKRAGGQRGLRKRSCKQRGTHAQRQPPGYNKSGSGRRTKRKKSSQKENRGVDPTNHIWGGGGFKRPRCKVERS